MTLTIPGAMCVIGLPSPPNVTSCADGMAGEGVPPASVAESLLMPVSHACLLQCLCSVLHSLPEHRWFCGHHWILAPGTEHVVGEDCRERLQVAPGSSSGFSPALLHGPAVETMGLWEQLQGPRSTYNDTDMMYEHKAEAGVPGQQRGRLGSTGHPGRAPWT